MSVEHGGHWYTYSVAARDDPGDVEHVLDALGGQFGEVERRGRFNQPLRIGHESGITVHFGSKHVGQRVVVNGEGEVCEGWWDLLVKSSVVLEGRVTRVDLAVEVKPDELASSRLREMRDMWRAGKVESAWDRKLCRWHEDDGDGQGNTLELGSTSGWLMLRAYDRRGPLRLEFQCRPAKEVGLAMPGVLTGMGVPALWRRFAYQAVWPLPWYQELLTGPMADWHAPRCDESGFVAAVQALREKYGNTVFGCKLMGLSLDDLATEPERPRGALARKYLRWAKEGTGMGYDGAKLEAWVRGKLRGRRVDVAGR